MRPIAVTNSLRRAFDAKLPTMLWGQPGIGKSSLVRQFCEQYGYGLIDQRLSQMDPVDLRGIPYKEGERTHWCVPEFLPDVDRDGKEGVLLLDEINSAAQSVQAAAYQIIQDRRLGSYELPRGWVTWAAGNNENDRAIVNKMSSALRNRFMHLDVEVHLEDWRSWAVKNKIRDEVLGFLAFRSGLLNTFNSEAAKAAKAFATPRSWEFVSRVMPTEQTTHDTEFGLYMGCVGEGPATELIGYLKYHRNLPNIDVIFLDPEKAPVPKEPATLYALATTLATRATVDNMDALTKYIDRIGQEYQVVCIKDAVTREGKLAETPAFNKWAVKNGNLMT